MRDGIARGGFSLETLTGLNAFRGIWAIDSHSNVRLNLGPLKWSIGAPELHHWYHDRAMDAENDANISPLVNGKTTFDPQVFGGKSLILFCDYSVRSFSIEPDGRALMNGKDIFDPAQPFWNGKVPPVKWPAK